MTKKKVDQGERMKAVERSAADRQRSSTCALMKQDPTLSPEVLDHAWEKAARAALSVEDATGYFFPDANGTKSVWQAAAPDFVDTAARDLRLTFEKFNLDPADPWSWRMMAQYMSLLFSAPQTKRGRPTEWTPEKLELLRQEREAENLTNGRLAKKLANDKTSPFQTKGKDTKAGVEGLRKRLGKVGTK
jgi:hypothetical protein